MSFRSSHRDQSSRLRRFEQLEDRRLLASVWQHPTNPCDVDASGGVTPRDALLVINDLDRHGSRLLPAERRTDPPAYYLDVNGDGSLAPLDALRVINALHEDRKLLAVTAHLSPESDLNGNGVVLAPQATMLGQTLPGAKVQAIAYDRAAGLGQAPSSIMQTQADAEGHFQLQIDLPQGITGVRLEAINRAGRSVVVERVIRRADVVLDWNAALLNVVRDWTTLSDDPYQGRVVTAAPPVVARNLAMVHAAMHDAVAAIDQTYEPYHVDLVAPQLEQSSAVAAASAAHRVASHLYQEPDELAVWDASLSEALAAVAEGPVRSAAIQLGQQVGDAIIAARSTDGAAATAQYVIGDQAGYWRRTSPGYLPPLLPQWPDVTPFALTSGDQFRPPPPPAIDSAEYAQAVDEVLRLGRLDSATRTGEQTEIALFWSDGGGTATPPGHWNEIAADVAIEQGISLADSARLMALLNLALADAGITAWDAKYAYDLWRPIDAIREGLVDGNSITDADLNWVPLLVTPPFPTYTSGHSTFSGAAQVVLDAIFGSDTSFTSQSDGHRGVAQRPLSDAQMVTRSFSSFQQAAEEAGRSRVYGGIHFSFDDAAGLASGRAVGTYVVGHLLQPRVAQP